MNKQDYLRQVDALAPSPALRAKIAAMAPRARRPRPPILRYAALAACLAAALLGGCILAYLTLEPGGELRPSPTPVATVTPSPIPEEELAWLLVQQHPDFEVLDVSYPAGELVYSQVEADRTLGIARFGSVHAAGLDNLYLGVFDNETREPLGEVFQVNGDQADLTTWTDESDGALRILCTNAVVYQGTESPTAVLFRFDGETLERVTELPPEALAADTSLAPGAETMFRPGTDFWADHKGVIEGTGLSIYDRNPNWDPVRSGESAQWLYLTYLPLGTAEEPAEEPSMDAFAYNYRSPMLPLTTDENSDILREEGIWLEREIHVDFQNAIFPVWYDDARSLFPRIPKVTERYTIHNDSDQPRELRLFYPWLGSLYTSPSDDAVPEITVNGEPNANPALPGSTIVLAGAPYDSYGSLSGWDAYEFLLSGGDYLRSTLEHPGEAALRDVPVSVYAVTGIQGSEELQDSAAVLSVDFTVSNPDRTLVLLSGFGGSIISGGNYHCDFRLDESRPSLPWIIVVGGEIETWSVTGYQDDPLTGERELPSLTAGLTRMSPAADPDWEDNLAYVLGRCLDSWFEADDAHPLCTRENLYQASCDLFYHCYAGALDEALGRGEAGLEQLPSLTVQLSAHLNSLFDEAARQDRLLFEDIRTGVIPAGGTATVEITYYHYPAVNVDTSAGAVPPGQTLLYGYDVATTLGSGLDFRSIRLEVTPYPDWDVLGQDTRLDPANGITQVELSPAVDRYCFTVRRTPQT